MVCHRLRVFRWLKVPGKQYINTPATCRWEESESGAAQVARYSAARGVGRMATSGTSAGPSSPAVDDWAISPASLDSNVSAMPSHGLGERLCQARFARAANSLKDVKRAHGHSGNQ